MHFMETQTLAANFMFPRTAETEDRVLINNILFLISCIPLVLFKLPHERDIPAFLAPKPLFPPI